METKNKITKMSDNKAIVGEWISVKEKVPEFDVVVLVYKSYHKKIDLGKVTSLDKTGYNWSCDYQQHITHWMPLPNPPLK